MTGKSVSFRAPLVSNTIDLLAKVGLDCAHTAKLISALVSQLAAYTEEGVPLTPTVFICNSIDSLVKLSGSGEYVSLSELEPMATASTKLLKASAPLCGENWRIYVERSADGSSCRYGVFCGTTDPSALTVEEVVLDEYKEGEPIIRVVQSGRNRVEVRTSTGEAIEFRFNDDTDVEVLDDQQKIAEFAALAAGGDSQLSSYIERLLSTALRKSHGSLLAVTASSSADLPDALGDAIKLTPPISLGERLRSHVSEGKSSGSVSRLQVATDLVCGFIASDGITVFNSGGQIIAYRCFVKGDPIAVVSGGARTRAYAVLGGMVGKELKAAFFRSEDGRTDVKVAEREAA